MASLVSHVIVIIRHSPELPFRSRKHFGYYCHGTRGKREQIKAMLVEKAVSVGERCEQGSEPSSRMTGQCFAGMF